MLELDALAVAHKVYEEHTADEAHRTEYPDGREVFHRVFPIDLKRVVSHGVGDCYGWHIERDAEGVKRVEYAELQVCTSLRGIPSGAQHKQGGQAVAE